MASGQWFVNDSIAEMTQESKDACISLLRATLAETELEVQRLQAKLLKQNLDSGEQYLEQLNQRALLMGAVEKMLALVKQFGFTGCRALAPDRLPPEGDIPAFCSWVVEFTTAALKALEEVKHLRRDKFGSTSEQGRYLGRPADEEETGEEPTTTGESDTGGEAAAEADGGKTESTAADADKSESRRKSSAGRNGLHRRELSPIDEFYVLLRRLFGGLRHPAFRRLRHSPILWAVFCRCRRQKTRPLPDIPIVPALCGFFNLIGSSTYVENQIILAQGHPDRALREESQSTRDRGVAAGRQPRHGTAQDTAVRELRP